jgi:transcriptional regulator with PAS, ATPase and Fis domain
MSAQITWGPAAVTTSAVGSHNEAVVDDRLITLKRVALTLLREIESLRAAEPVRVDRSLRLYDEVKRFETDLILSALGRTRGNQTRAAQLLGVKVTTLNSKIKRYKISLPGYDDIDERPDMAA